MAIGEVLLPENVKRKNNILEKSIHSAFRLKPKRPQLLILYEMKMLTENGA